MSAIYSGLLPLPKQGSAPLFVGWMRLHSDSWERMRGERAEQSEMEYLVNDDGRDGTACIVLDAYPGWVQSAL